MTTQTLENWKKVKLGDVAKIESGGTPSSAKSEYWDGGNICWATLPDLENKYFFDTQRKITPLGLKNSSAKLLPINSVIFSSRATIGEISIAKVKTSTNQGSKNFICDPTKIDYEFLYYLLKSKVEEINNLASGATYKEINKTVLSSVEIEIPDISTQKQIADVLSVYDDLIEKNSRRIQILEQMAQEIYKEWFVNFRFPGHEKVKMIDSGTDFGKIPEGWEIAKLPEVFDFLEGPGIRNWQYTPTGCPFINIRLIKNNDINISSASFISKEEADGKYNHFHLQERDMVVSTSGTLGRSAIVRKEHLPLLLNTSVIRFRPNNGRSYAFMYQFLNADYFQNKILSMASGSAQPNFGPIHLKQIDMLVPSERVLDSFGDLVNLIYDGIAVYLSENQRLRQTRDLLSPKLVTGEVEVR
ncbi:MAG TPA: type I restriction endonuclease subunit S [Bacteroidales bacterium]|nr:type I restriction endonuclease subunit S [Bacteroidales bacterium]